MHRSLYSWTRQLMRREKGMPLLATKVLLYENFKKTTKTIAKGKKNSNVTPEGQRQELTIFPLMHDQMTSTFHRSCLNRIFPSCVLADSTLLGTFLN